VDIFRDIFRIFSSKYLLKFYFSHSICNYRTSLCIAASYGYGGKTKEIKIIIFMYFLCLKIIIFVKEIKIIIV